jgi:hypothetical protein
MPNFNSLKKSNIAFIIGILSLFQQSLYGQKVEGKVIDEENKQPVSFVTIGVVNKSGGTYSDEKGNYSLDLSGYQHSDTLKFSCIGYKPEIITVEEMVNKYKNLLCIINLKVNHIQLSEVIVKPKKFQTKVLGNKISNRHIGLTIGNNSVESGIIIPNDKKLFLYNASFKLMIPSSLDSVVLQFNVYDVKNNLPNENILKQPVNIHLRKDQLVENVSFDLEKYNIIVEKDFCITLDVVKKYGKGILSFAGWLTGYPTYVRTGKQGAWIIPKADRNGMKIYQRLNVTVQYEK